MSKKEIKTFSWTDHLANERTFLAWIRTNLGIMAFGFVTQKFAFFIEKIGILLQNSEHSATTPPSTSFPSLFGISLVGIGSVLCLFAFFKFKKVERQINNKDYHSSSILEALLAMLIFLTGVLLIIYLLRT